MDKITNIHDLDNRREEKVLTHGEKLRRMPSHPMHAKLKELTKTG